MITRRRSAALNALEELAALPDLGAEGLRAMMLAVTDLVSVEGAVVDVRNPDCEVVGCVGDGDRFDDALIQRFFRDFYDTSAEDAMGPNCRTLFRDRHPLAVTTQATAGWPGSELCQDFFEPERVGDVIRIPLWRSTVPIGLLVLGRDLRARPLTEPEVLRMRELKPLFERIVDRVTAPTTPGQYVGDVTWIARPDGEIELASPDADDMAAMAFGLEGILPRTRQQVTQWLRETFCALRAKLERGEPAGVERRNGYGSFEFRASWLDGRGGATPRTRLSVRLTRHVSLKTRLFLSERFRLLPRREKQTVLALADGSSTQEMADQLAVAPSTALSWIRSLYVRFDVNRRGQLLDLLLADAAAASTSAVQRA